MQMATRYFTSVNDFLLKRTEAAPLAAFRVLFGLLMAISLLRFWYHGWIETLYILPKFHFHYWGFDFVTVPGNYTYLLFFICFLASLGVALGFKYRWSIIIFFLSFTYIELMDKTTYLNHYYFVSVVSFIMIWLPAHCYFSIDASVNKKLNYQYIARWNIDLLKLFVGMVYIFAGLAKLNSDWMLEAKPLSIWLPSKMNIPLLGSIIHEKYVHYLFSWAGAFYDIFIVFFLLWKRTRIFAFILVVIFHLLTRVLFPIGMFPYIMIVSTLLFFGVGFHHKLIQIFSKLIGVDSNKFRNEKAMPKTKFYSLGTYVLAIVMSFQLLFPLRHFLFTKNIYWTEIAYRFSWRVMLMEKTGYAQFKIVNEETGKRFFVQNEDFLTPLQQKQMSTQADFMIEYAKYLGDHFESQGHGKVAVYVDSHASLNGRRSQRYIDPNVDLRKLSNNPFYRPYILPLDE